MSEKEYKEKTENMFIKNTVLINENEALKKENEELKKDKEWLDNTNNEQTVVILELQQQIEQLSNDNYVLKTAFITQKEQNEKMKCCGNCEYELGYNRLRTKENTLFCCECRKLDETKDNILLTRWKLRCR